jgi:hypothetical protein
MLAVRQATPNDTIACAADRHPRTQQLGRTTAKLLTIVVFLPDVDLTRSFAVDDHAM